MGTQAPKKRISAANRRELILDAARDAFAAGGFHQTALDEVADRAGVSKALLYEHFDSKRELHAAMLERHVDELIGRISAALLAADPGEDRLRAGMHAFFTFVQERRGAWHIMFRNPGDPDVAASLERLREQIRVAIVALMKEEAATRNIPELEPYEIEMLAQQLIGGLQSLADWWDGHPEVPLAEVMGVGMSSLWLGHERLLAGERWSAP